MSQKNSLDLILSHLQEKWPTYHKVTVDRQSSYSTVETALLHNLAEKIVAIKQGAIESAVENFVFTCKALVVEEIYFRRNNEYRLKTEQEAYQEVYSDSEFMSAYLDGLLLTHLFWDNHFRGFKFFKEKFVDTFAEADVSPKRIVEIGPGHGLYLAEVANALKETVCEGIDISASSIAHSKSALEILYPDNDIKLFHDNIYNYSSSDEFDGIVIGEVLEHVEDPLAILKKLRNHLSDKGRLFLNIPINSPAPDHIYLFRNADEIFELINLAGLKVVFHESLPMSGYSLDRAKKSQATISFVAICSRAG